MEKGSNYKLFFKLGITSIVTALGASSVVAADIIFNINNSIIDYAIPVSYVSWLTGIAAVSAYLFKSSKEDKEPIFNFDSSKILKTRDSFNIKNDPSQLVIKL